MKILVVRFSSIGDVVLTTPIVRCLKQQLNAEVHYVTKKSFATILQHNPNIDKLITIEKSIDEVVGQLKSEQYDHVVDLHKNIRTYSLKKKLGKPSTSFPKLNFQKWLLVQFKSDKMPNVHVVDRYFEAVKSLGVENDNLPCDYFIQSEDEIDVKQELGVKPKEYVAFAIGAQFETKVLPVHKIVEIVKEVKLPVVLMGGPTDTENAEKIVLQLKEFNVSVFNAVGKFTLNQSASIVKQCKTLLTHDTGLMHIATCFSIPIISIWGNTVPALGMYPYQPRTIEGSKCFEVPNLSCRPCSKIGFHSCPKKHFNCMEFQDSKGIAAVVNEIN